jgi:hypothetical protein
MEHRKLRYKRIFDGNAIGKRPIEYGKESCDSTSSSSALLIFPRQSSSLNRVLSFAFFFAHSNDKYFFSPPFVTAIIIDTMPNIRDILKNKSIFWKKPRRIPSCDFSIAIRENCYSRLRKDGPWTTFCKNPELTDGPVFEVRRCVCVLVENLPNGFVGNSWNSDFFDAFIFIIFWLSRRWSELGECSMFARWRNGVDFWNSFGTQSTGFERFEILHQPGFHSWSTRG